MPIGHFNFSIQLLNSLQLGSSNLLSGFQNRAINPDFLLLLPSKQKNRFGTCFSDLKGFEWPINFENKKSLPSAISIFFLFLIAFDSENKKKMFGGSYCKHLFASKICGTRSR